MFGKTRNSLQRRDVIKLALILFFIVLTFRIFYLQVINTKYRSIAFDNAIYKKTIYPNRGMILDREDKPLLNNIITYYLVIVPSLFKNIDTAYFCELIQTDINEFRKKLNRLISKNDIYRPIVYQTIFSNKIIAALQENMYKLNGVELQERTIRSYPSRVAANVLGYIGEVDSNILKKHDDYLLGDNIGLSGLEFYYEKVLRGVKGVYHVVRNNKNKYLGSYEDGVFDIEPKSGKNLRTHISLPIQELSEKLLQNKIGSIIVSDPRTGGIIAMASGPVYDPNLLTGKYRNSNFYALFKDETSPFLNRSIKGTYSPGSTIKPIFSLIGLQEGVITPQYGFNCHGAYTYCGKIFACTHSSAGHAANLRLAIANSCNSYFIHLFRMIIDNDKYGDPSIGLAVWKKYLNSFGLGHPLGIDLPYEGSGYVPDAKCFDKIFLQKWNSCNIASLGMGQGELLLTPIQLLNLTSMIANRGYYYTPHLVKNIDNATPEENEILERYIKKNIVTNIPTESYDDVIDAMSDVVNFGTAQRAKLKDIEVCAKTGTVENKRVINGQVVKMPNHSIFIAFAPKDNPKVAITVIVENSGGFGSTWAAPMASLIIERYLKGSLSAERSEEVEKLSNKNLIPAYLLQMKKEREIKENIKLITQFSDDMAYNYIDVDTLLSPNIKNKYKDTIIRKYRDNVLPKKDTLSTQ